MFGNKQNATAKKPTIRRETVLVSVKKTVSNGVSNGVQKRAAPTPGSRFQLSHSAAKPLPPLKKKPTAPAQRALAASRGHKRKSATPEVHFSSDEEEDYSSEIGASDSDASRKRLKSSANSLGISGPKRDLVSEQAFEGTNEKDYVQGVDATSGEYAGKFKNPWNQEDFSVVELQYPSNNPPERFELKWPKNEKDDYKPMEDIIETVKQVTQFYFPEDLCEKYTNGGTSFARRYHRAWVEEDIPKFLEITEEFNRVLKSLLEDGKIKPQLASRQQLPLDLVRRILNQIYARTVSPKVETLRAYQNGSDNVYGELLPRFCSNIFRKTKMDQKTVFVDLGSGVGNVVLQAALEVGCESWGIEMMKNPCDLADLQAKEFPARTRLWGIAVGDVRLLRGDFTKHPDMDGLLQRADVVLVNNQAFTPALNDRLRDMFLSLKDGCQVVSLKPFVPQGHKISTRNVDSVANMFVQHKFEYFSDSVSWTDGNDYYYIATKDPRPLIAFKKAHGLA